MMKIYQLAQSFFCLGTLCLLLGCGDEERSIQLLLFTKTEGFRHNSIETGIEALKEVADKHGYHLVHTEDANYFSEDSLPRFSAVIFLNTTGDVLNATQQADFERYIQSGGGFVGVHAAADTEYDWDWYGALVGAYFESHPNDPNVLDADLDVVDNMHLSTRTLPEKWPRTDEWYNFKDIHGDLINVLITIDEASYQGGTNGKFHPMAWYHEYDGGRAFYTGLGHTAETYSETLFLDHLVGGIEYAVGENMSLDYSKATSQRF